MDEIKAIEDAALNAAAALKAEGVKTVELYTGQLTESDIEDITYRFPCVYLVAEGVEFEQENAVRRGTTGLTVFAGDRNVRGDSLAKRGDSESPGVYYMLKRLKETLHMLRVQNGMTPLMIKAVAPLIYAPESGLVVYKMDFECKFVVRDN